MAAAQAAAQPLLLLAVAGNPDFGVRETLPLELVLDGLEPTHTLFGRQPPTVSDAHDVVLPVAPGGMIQLGVDAAFHQRAGPSGGPLEQRGQLGVGRESALREAVEQRGRAQGQAFSGTAGGYCYGRPQPAQLLPQPASGVLMNVGMPGSHQRDVEAARSPDAQNAVVAGPGDVNHVGLETLELGREQPAMA